MEMVLVQNEYLLQNENFFNITDELRQLSKLCEINGIIDKELYAKYDVKRGLRDINGKGVLAGLTEISEICSSTVENGVSKPCDGKLYYRGIDVEDIVTLLQILLKKCLLSLNVLDTCCIHGILGH